MEFSSGLDSAALQKNVPYRVHPDNLTGWVLFLQCPHILSLYNQESYEVFVQSVPDNRDKADLDRAENNL